MRKTQAGRLAPTINDRDHTADLTRMISTYIDDPQDGGDVEHVADVVGDLYVGMFHQIAAREGR